LHDFRNRIFSNKICKWAWDMNRNKIILNQLYTAYQSFTSALSVLPLFRCVLASLYEGLSVRPSIRLSVRPSVRRSVGRSRFRRKRENLWFWSQIMMSHVISSSYNHFIIMRTHRWPYGPCFSTHLYRNLSLAFITIWMKVEQAIIYDMQRNPTIAYFKGPVDFMPYCER